MKYQIRSHVDRVGGDNSAGLPQSEQAVLLFHWQALRLFMLENALDWAVLEFVSPFTYIISGRGTGSHDLVLAMVGDDIDRWKAS